jgi:hypothetical protein
MRFLLPVAAVLALVLAAGCGPMDETDDIDVASQIQAQLEKPEPHCSNGDCTGYAEWCMLKGREPMCLNGSTDHAVTVCIGQKAKVGIMNHHPDACLGTCSHPTVCN